MRGENLVWLMIIPRWVYRSEGVSDTTAAYLEEMSPDMIYPHVTIYSREGALLIIVASILNYSDSVWFYGAIGERVRLLTGRFEVGVFVVPLSNFL